ncbi:uncharacterized protein LOC106667486 [Cimex lectularius]|uniref:Uncharacterized protein n=1 Tax=Cimex lectularius TaxID=79782 RepID=A0A8I6RU26_CIMLE|nr:uncharacterized protein LOC106667486 [Cimex lectularius]
MNSYTTSIEQQNKQNLKTIQENEAKKLLQDIKVLAATIEWSRQERGFIDESLESPQVRLKFSKSSNLNDEIKDLKAENHTIQVHVKPLAQMFLDKNMSIFDNRKLIKDISNLFVLPNLKDEEYKDFHTLKRLLEATYKSIIKATLDRIELENKTKAIENRGKELGEKYEFLYVSCIMTEDFKQQDSLMASIKSLEIENDYFQSEINRLIEQVEGLQQSYSHLDTLTLANINKICSETFGKRLGLLRLLYQEDKSELTNEDLLSRKFASDKRKVEKIKEECDNGINRKKQELKELTATWDKLQILKKKSPKVHR